MNELSVRSFFDKGKPCFGHGMRASIDNVNLPSVQFSVMLFFKHTSICLTGTFSLPGSSGSVKY